MDANAGAACLTSLMVCCLLFTWLRTVWKDEGGGVGREVRGIVTVISVLLNYGLMGLFPYLPLVFWIFFKHPFCNLCLARLL